MKLDILKVSALFLSLVFSPGESGIVRRAEPNCSLQPKTKNSPRLPCGLRGFLMAVNDGNIEMFPSGADIRKGLVDLPGCSFVEIGLPASGAQIDR